MIQHSSSPTTQRHHGTRPQAGHDDGFSVVEMLVTIAVVGILATILTFWVSNLHAQAAGSTCDADQRNLWTAAESYFAQNDTDEIPATGVGSDRYERTLAEDGFLRDHSSNFDLDASGATTPQGGSPC